MPNVSPTNGPRRALPRTPYSEFLVKMWLPTAKRTIRESTYESYSSHVRRHITPRLGDVPLGQLSGPVLNDVYSELLDAGLSETTVARIHATVHRSLRDAVRWGALTQNPANEADPPRDRGMRSRKMRTWSGRELASFLEGCLGHPLHDLWCLLAMTGMRRGEALGLQWSDLNLGQKRLAVRETIVLVNGRRRPSSPKTAKGRRVIALDEQTARMLEVRSTRSGSKGFVFADSDGGPMCPSKVTKSFARCVAASGLPRIRLHDLRHTHATLALTAGVHPKIVSERLGHSTVSFTLDVYSHSNSHLQELAAEAMADLVFGRDSGSGAGTG